MSVSIPRSRRLLWRLLIASSQVTSQKLSEHEAEGTPSEQGFSLLECLMAIAIIVLTVTMILPPIFIATATRAQNRRAEQALQIAQGELDRLQVLVTQGQHIPTRIPAAVGAFSATNPPPPNALAGRLKTINSSCPATYGSRYNDEQIATNLALPVDVDGDCQPDFLLQSFRDTNIIPIADNSALRPEGKNRPTNFTIGVRVYSFLANGNWANLKTDQASLKLTTGQGSQRTRPLAVLYARMNWSDKSSNVCVIQNPATQSCN